MMLRWVYIKAAANPSPLPYARAAKLIFATAGMYLSKSPAEKETCDFCNTGKGFIFDVYGGDANVHGNTGR